MARTSRGLLSLPLPCEPRQAARLARRLQERLAAEAAAGRLFAALGAVLAAVAYTTLPEPAAVRIGYSLFFAVVSVLSLAYSRRRICEAKAVAELASMLEQGFDPGWLCEKDLRGLLREALKMRRSGKE